MIHVNRKYDMVASDIVGVPVVLQDTVTMEIEISLGQEVGKPEMLDSVNLSSLVPALTQIFLTITIGYCAGLTNVITREQSGGLHLFLAKFSLPTLLFISLAKLDFTNVSWRFLLSVFLTKESLHWYCAHL